RTRCRSRSKVRPGTAVRATASSRDEPSNRTVPGNDARLDPRRVRQRSDRDHGCVHGRDRLLGLEVDAFPAIWDADFLHGPKSAAGDDTYVLCEINVSAVWPYPPDASTRLAHAALARIVADREQRR